MKKRPLPLLLTVIALFSLLPTVALAATTTGSSISYTTNTNHWIQRTNHSGQTYTYKFPLIDGKWGYCVDFGFSYSTNPSFLSTYDWTYATGADAEALLERAVTISGMNEYSDEVLDNVKWLMSYINQHYSLDEADLGAYMMCVQTYVWDNMSRKAYGDTSDGGQIDDGGYADPATYEKYVRMYTDLLTIKAEEDAELQRQIADYAEQGIDAYVIADPNSQWAVYAVSSISGRQGFFNYNEERVVNVGEKPGDEPDLPDEGEPGIVTITKRDSRTQQPLAGATYRIEGIDNGYTNSVTTGRSGVAVVEGLLPGSFEVFEEAPPEGYLPSGEVQTFHYDGQTAVNLTFLNDPTATIELYKLDAESGAETSAVFDVFHNEQHIDTIRVDGHYTISGLSEGTYKFVEVSCEGNYILDDTPHSIYVEPGSTMTAPYELTVTNHRKLGLELLKLDRTSLQPLEGVTFSVYHDGELYGEFQTDENGLIYLNNIDPGTWTAVEKETDPDHLVNSVPQTIELHVGDPVRRLIFFNDLKPGIHILKLDTHDLSTPLPNARFEIKAVDGSWGPEEFTTAEDGTIDLSKLPTGAYVVTELECPGYVVDDAQRIIHLDGNENAEFVFTNSKLPSLLLTKTSADGTPLAGVSYRLAKIEDGGHYLDRTTGPDGTILWEGLEPGVYSLTETATVSDHILDPVEHHIQLFPGKVSTITLENNKRPNLYIHKNDADTGDPIPGTVYLVKGADGHSIAEVETDEDGVAVVENLLPGVVEVIEKSVPEPYLLAEESQTVTLYPNRDRDVYFENYKRPVIEIIKENEITHDPLENVPVQVWYASNNTATGEYNDLGVYYTDEDGRIVLSDPDLSLRDGWFRIEELEAPKGFSMTESSKQEAFIAAGEGHTFRIFNRPLSAICVWKYDSETGAAIEGAVFQVRYLSGNTSGTGGTVIGTYRTSMNGSFTVTGCEPGTYIIEELSSDGSHVIDTPPQTVYLSGEEQEVVQVYFGNSPMGSLLIKKVSSADNSPISDVQFFVTESDGSIVGDGNGYFVTDSAGTILIEGIEPGTTLVVKETRAQEGFLLDDTPQTAQIKAGQTVTLEFRNQPEGNLVIHKLSNADRKTPLEGVQFKITYADGSYLADENGHLSSNGLYWSNSEGQIVLSNVTGTLVVTEVQSIPGYTIDPNTQSQTVVVNPDDTQELWFYNAPVGGIEIIKVNASKTSERIPDTTFEIRRMDDGLVDTITTDRNGRAFLSLEDGSYYAVEVEANPDFILDDTPHYFEVKDGEVTTLRLANAAKSGILIHKVDPDGNGIYGVTFLLYDADHRPIGQYTSDDRGYVYIDGLTESGRYYLRELENEGYIVDEELKTVYVKAGEVTEVEWENTPITGQIQVTKTSEDYNTMNGWPAGTPLPNTEFEIYNARTGNLADTIRTDKNGVAVSKPLPLARYKIVESKATDYYGLDKTPIEVDLEYEGQIVKVAMTNKSLYTNVSIKKTGYVEVMPGQEIRYDIAGIANNSTTALESFFWRDTLPTQAVRLEKIVTGTYNVQGNYKVVYKTNLSGDTWRTLADNLSTQQNYVLDASAAALGLASNEYITEFMVSFGIVPGNFRQVEAPQVYGKVLSGLVGGTKFTNAADVGGVYDGQWIMAVSRWVTTVYKPSQPLPRTGY